MGQGAAFHGKPGAWAPIAGARRIAGLNHKRVTVAGVRDDPVEDHISVVPILRQLQKMFRRVWRGIPPHLDGDLTVIRSNHDQLVRNQSQAGPHRQHFSNRSGFFELSFVLGLHAFYQLPPRTLHRGLGVGRWTIGEDRWFHGDVEFVSPTHHSRVGTTLWGGGCFHDGHLT